ncbi:MAG: hypothetical protein N3D10_02035 [Candidatus Micrarchaeota archaeon]|nr:hypothetical protein [Candidatus Micrarchaeota archaeon]
MQQNQEIKLKKGQSASEYLATYGWAFLIIFFILIYLINSGLFTSSRFMSEECSFQTDFSCLRHYNTFSKDSNKINLAIELSNGMGFPILIKSCNAWVFPDSQRTKGDCSDVYLESGERRFFIINNIKTNKKLIAREMEKILVEIEFKGCKGQTIDECKKTTSATYLTQGKIITQLIEGNEFVSTTFGDCIGGEKRCNGNQPQGCWWDEQKKKFTWKNEGLPCLDPYICVQSGKDAYCVNKNIPSNQEVCVEGVKRCKADILQVCSKGAWKDSIDCTILGMKCKVIPGKEAQCAEEPTTGESDIGRREGGLGIDLGCKIGDTTCLSSDPSTIYQCIFDNSIGRARYMPIRSCSTQCEEINDVAQCAQCKENTIQCFLEPPYKRYAKCEKQQQGALGWSQYSCPQQQKCINDRCVTDNRAICDEGLKMCGSPQDWMRDQRTVYICMNGQWVASQTCRNICYKGVCVNEIRPDDIDECTMNGERRCTQNYLTVEECRAGQWVRIQNCIGDYYCSVTGQGTAECVR